MHNWLISLTLAALIAPIALGAPGDEPKPVDPLLQLSQRLKAIYGDKSRSYHQLLRDAAHEVRQAALDRRWSEVEKALEQQGLKRIRERSQQHSMDYRYLVATDGWIGSDASAHALFIDFSVDRRSQKEVKSAKPQMVMTTEVGLRIEINRPHADVLKEKRYPIGTVLEQGMRQLVVLDSAEKYPILKEMEVIYDYLRYKHGQSLPQGFSLFIELGASPDDDKRGKRHFFTTESGLDPVIYPKGQEPGKPFEPQDTLSDFQSWGGSEWSPAEK